MSLGSLFADRMVGWLYRKIMDFRLFGCHGAHVQVLAFVFSIHVYYIDMIYIYI